MKKLLRLNLVVSALTAVVLVAALVVLVGRPSDVQVMSASGYAFQLKDGEGDSIFNVTDAGVIEYGSNDLHPLGHASDDQQLVYGTDEITDTITVNHGLSTVTFCVATLGADADTDADDPVVVTTLVSGNDCTIKAWQDDWSAAATAEDVHWMVVGAP